MKVVILAGGYGTRMSEETGVKPKPMVEIGGKPIIWHIAQHYSCYGFKEFVIALGYKAEVIKSYFIHYHQLAGNITVDLGTGEVAVKCSNLDDWKVHLVDTGIDTLTGGRLKRLEPLLSRNEPFMLTYGDGVSSVDLNDLLAFHRKTGCLATVTAVRPPSRFGGLVLERGLVKEFTEKPQIGEGWINGGFMVLEPMALQYLQGDQDVLEIDLLERLAEHHQLAGYRHAGFWQCMDTLRDKNLLERLWESGSPPWKCWE